MKLFQRKCVLEETGYHLGGIGGVFTVKSYRRRGIAVRMLHLGMLGLKELGADVAYLCTDMGNLSELYWSFGFRHMVQGHTYLGKSGKRYTEKDGMMAPVNSVNIFMSLMRSKLPIDIGVGNW